MVKGKKKKEKREIQSRSVPIHVHSVHSVHSDGAAHLQLPMIRTVQGVHFPR